jgi:hypothetical protein
MDDGNNNETKIKSDIKNSINLKNIKENSDIKKGNEKKKNARASC